MKFICFVTLITLISNFISSTNGCFSKPEGPKPGTKVLIVTGKPAIDGVKSEILDLETLESPEDVECRDFPNFPKEIKGSTGVRLGRHPVICGGLYWEHRPLPTEDDILHSSDECFTLNKRSSFIFRKMAKRRAFAGSVVINNSTIWIMGGHDVDNNITYASTEFIHKVGESEPGPDLPNPLRNHVVVPLSESVTIIIGGWTPFMDYSDQTWYFNHIFQNFIKGPRLPVGRQGHSAGMLTDHVTSEEIIIVAGGFNKGQILKSTEMLRYGEWEAGPNLPKKLYGHSVIGFEKDLYVLGGNSGFWYEKAIHRLRCSNADCRWSTMKASLKVRRQYFVAIPMNTSQVTCISLLPED